MGSLVQGLGSEEVAACEVVLRQLALRCLLEGVVEAAHVHPSRFEAEDVVSMMGVDEEMPWRLQCLSSGQELS